MNTDDAGRVVRRVWGGGRWFPGDPRELTRTVADCIEGARVPSLDGRIVGAIAPHAGYVYSGKVAGHTFRALRDNAARVGAPDVVVVLGFCHQSSYRGVAWMDGDAIETPAGEVALDAEARDLLASGHERLFCDYTPHAGEWSAENEIPFVQTALSGVGLVVGLMGDHEQATLDALVAALGTLALRKRVLVVASSDLLHDADYDKVTRTDKQTIETIAALDTEGLQGSWSYRRQVCCGIGPVVTAMRFARDQGCRAGVVLRYRNSGDDNPESRGNWVVGYGSVVFAV